MIEALENDDIYAVDYNNDLERYVVDVNGGETHSDVTLRKAFASAKAEVLAKAKAKADAEAAAAKPKAATKPAKAPKAAKPTSPPTGVQAPPVAQQKVFPEHIAQALADVTVAMANLMRAAGVFAGKAASGVANRANGEIVDELPEFNEPEIEQQAPPPPKRGFTQKKV